MCRLSPRYKNPISLFEHALKIVTQLVNLRVGLCLLFSAVALTVFLLFARLFRLGFLATTSKEARNCLMFINEVKKAKLINAAHETMLEFSLNQLNRRIHLKKKLEDRKTQISTYADNHVFTQQILHSETVLQSPEIE